MFFKLLTAIVVILAVAYLLAGRRGALPSQEPGRAPARLPRADDLVSCGRCGVWLPAGQRCDCAEAARVAGS
jgi:hypothetical protein